MMLLMCTEKQCSPGHRTADRPNYLENDFPVITVYKVWEREINKSNIVADNISKVFNCRHCIVIKIERKK